MVHSDLSLTKYLVLFFIGKRTFKLTSPFIKVEACNNRYQPMCKTLDDFVGVDLTLPPGTCPFSRAEKESVEQKITDRYRKHQKKKRRSVYLKLIEIQTASKFR